MGVDWGTVVVDVAVPGPCIVGRLFIIRGCSREVAQTIEVPIGATRRPTSATHEVTINGRQKRLFAIVDPPIQIVTSNKINTPVHITAG
jgi:hypothetical protein